MVRFRTFGMLIALTLVLSACGLATPTPTPEPSPTPQPPLTAEEARDLALDEFVTKHEDLTLPDKWVTIETAGGLLGVNALRFVADGWTVDVQAPVVLSPSYAVRVVHESGAEWEGSVTADRTVLTEPVGPFAVDSSFVTQILGDVLANPQDWAGRYVRVVGTYEGWDELGSAGTPPPVTKSDWVIHDGSGAIYVAAGSGDVLGMDSGATAAAAKMRLELFAEVQVTDAGQPYLSILSGERIGPEDDAWIEYDRSGGIAGFQDHLTLYADGRAVLTRKGVETDFALTEEQMEALKAAFASADFLFLRHTYLPSNPCCDRFSYAVHYRDPDTGAVQSVYTMDGTVPAALQPILDALNPLLTPSM